VNDTAPADERSSAAAWFVWAIVYLVLVATLINAPIYTWTLHRQGGTALGTEPDRGGYYLLHRRMIQTQADAAGGQATTTVDRDTWVFNLYYTAASRLSFVLGFGCFLLVMGRTLVRQYFAAGPDETRGRPGRFSLRFAAVVVAAFFALVAWEIGGSTVRVFLHSYTIHNKLQP
jgi:hypothetical protein